MARDTYEMTSSRCVLSYGLGFAKYMPPTVSRGLPSLLKLPVAVARSCSLERTSPLVGIRLAPMKRGGGLIS